MTQSASMPTILFVGESSGLRKLIADGVPGFEAVSINSLNNIDVYFKAFPERQITVVVVDYMAATEGMGGGSTTVSSKQRLLAVKTLALCEGQDPRIIIGISAHEIWHNQLKGFGCDAAVSEEALLSAIDQAMKQKPATSG